MMAKRIFAALLAAMMVGGLTACGGDSQTDSSQAAGGNSGESTQTAEEPVNPKGEYPIVNETYNMSVLITQLPWVSDITTNDYTKWLEETTNIHLDMTVVADEGLRDKLNLMLSTDDYPEVIMSGAASSNNDVVKYGMEEGIYIPLNDYIEKYSENLVERWEEMPEIEEGMTAPDGNVYVLPVFEGYVGHGAVGYKQWINQGWLDKLGLSVPTTTDEYYEVLKAFKEQDPNGNGQADEVPLSGATGTWAADPYLFVLNAFDHYDESLIRLKDNEFTGCANTDGFKEGLKFLNKLYVEGLLDPASLTQDGTQLQQLAQNDGNILGAYSAGHIGMGIDTTNKEIFDNWTYILPLTGPEGYQGTPVSDKQTINGGPFAITDKCKNPAAAFRMADMWFGDLESYQKQNWEKGRIWEDAEPGTKGVTGYDALFKNIPKENTEMNTDNWAATTANGAMKEAKLYLQFEGDPKDAANYEGYLIQVTEEYKKYDSEYEQIMPAWFDAATAEELNNLFTPINDYVKASIVDFISGVKNVDTDWDAYISGLEQLGYSDYIAKYQAAYFAK